MRERAPGQRLCPECGGTTDAAICCGVRLAAPFRMTAQRVQVLRRYAHGRKGLDEATYRLHLRAVGVTSTLALNREQHATLMQRLGRLPDRNRRQPKVLQGRAR